MSIIYVTIEVTTRKYQSFTTHIKHTLTIKLSEKYYVNHERQTHYDTCRKSIHYSHHRNIQFRLKY